MTKRYEVVGAQGEITILRVVEGAPNAADLVGLKRWEKNDKGWIVSHSESGNHHILDGGDVMERPADDKTAAGLQILYALLETPATLFQDAATPHEAISLDAGVYEFRIAREYSAVSEQVRQVAD